MAAPWSSGTAPARGCQRTQGCETGPASSRLARSQSTSSLSSCDDRAKLRDGSEEAGLLAQAHHALGPQHSGGSIHQLE
eukprot:681161-Amphidinium_carterae.1